MLKGVQLHSHVISRHLVYIALITSCIRQ